jgi:uncharacterized membrane protein YidH (DUF202 family)
MAWIRTSLSMIGFGFSIHKFFQYLPEEIAARNIDHPQASRNLGLSPGNTGISGRSVVMAPSE